MKKNKFEDSPQDEREDRAMAKKLGMSKAKWERTDANKKHDAEGQKKMAKKKMAMGGPAVREGEMGRGDRMGRGPRVSRPDIEGSGKMRPGRMEGKAPVDGANIGRRLGMMPEMSNTPASLGSKASSAMGGAIPSGPERAGPGMGAALLGGKGVAGSPMGRPVPGGLGSAMTPGAGPSASPLAMRGAAIPTMAMKKGGVVKKMAKGGAVRGCGCAARGVKKAKTY